MESMMILTKKATGTLTVDTMQRILSGGHQAEMEEFVQQLVAQNKTDGILNENRVNDILLRDRYFIDQPSMDEYINFCGNWATTYEYDITLTGSDV